MAVNPHRRARLRAAEAFATRDFIEIPSLADKGEIVQAQQIFGKQRLNEVLDELQGVLGA